MTVLVVRKFDNFSRVLSEKGFSVISCPTIETVAYENSLKSTGENSPVDYDGIFLTSQKATEIANRELFSKKNYSGQVFILGKSSFEILKDKNLRLSFDKTANTAQEMLERIPAEELKGKRFLFIRGEKSLGTVRNFLEKIAVVDERIVYETRKVTVEEILKTEISAKAKHGEITCTCFFSPSGAESFLEQFGREFFNQTKIAVIGKTTADFFAKQNLRTNFIATKATAEDFAVELIDYLTNGKLKTENEK
ncbi:MAG TPA: uroporphyrinogen-III synthase [Pyrinomonadaceae bacterium]|nr:uroporphyrinogen-III synthase [Pyrinomonadaceae bacterium]